MHFLSSFVPHVEGAPALATLTPNSRLVVKFHLWTFVEAALTTVVAIWATCRCFYRKLKPK